MFFRVPEYLINQKLTTDNLQLRFNLFSNLARQSRRINFLVFRLTKFSGLTLYIFANHNLKLVAKSEHHDNEILNLLTSDPDRAIDLLFRTYYAYICKSIYRIIPDQNITEDLAQDVFYEIWKKRNRFQIKTSLKAYLRRAGMNKALNYIRDKKIKWDDADALETMETNAPGSGEKLEAIELQKQIEKAINELPERCRIVFSLSRFEEMTYQQIADHLGISIKTVENQISKALKLLRVKLGSYLSVGVLFWGLFRIFT